MEVDDCFKLPELLQTYKDKFDARFLSKSLIHNALENSFPKREAFQNCYEIFNQLDHKNSSNSLSGFYSVVMKAINDRMISYMEFAMQQKFKDGLALEHFLDFEVLGKYNPEIKKAYSQYLKKMTVWPISGVQGFYRSEEDLLYDSYVANEMADFLTSYDKTIFNHLMLSMDANPYYQVFDLFNASSAFGKGNLQDSLIDKQVFIESFKKNPKSYSNVIEDISSPYQFLPKFWNKNKGRRDAYVDIMIKISVYEAFINFIVRPKMIDAVKDAYIRGMGSDKYENSDAAILDMSMQYDRLIFNLRNPYKHEDHDIELVEKVFRMNIQSQFPGLVEFLDENAKVKSLPLIDPSSFPVVPPMNLGLGQKKVVKIFEDRAEPANFSILALGNTAAAFTVGKYVFSSIFEFITFACLEEIIGTSDEIAYSLRTSNIQHHIDNAIACSMKEAIINSVKSHKDVVKKIKHHESEIVFNIPIPDIKVLKFFLRYLGRYITNFTLPVDDGKLMIDNKIIVDWAERRIHQLMFVFEEVRKYASRPGGPGKKTTSKKDAIYNLWSLIFGLEKIEAKVTLPKQKESLLYKDAHEYVCRELSFVLAQGMDIDTVAKIIADNEDIPRMYPDFSKDDMVFLVESVYYKISNYITIDKTFDNLAFKVVANIVGMNELNLDRNELWNLLSLDSKLMNRFKCMYHLHSIKGDEFF